MTSHLGRTASRWSAVTAAVSLLALAGCGAPSAPKAAPKPKPVQTSAAPSPSPSPSPTFVPHPPADGTNIDACSDGTCEISFSGSIEVSMADRFNLNSLHLAVKDGVVTCDTTFPSGTVSSSQSGPGGSIGFGSAGSPQILIKVETVANGTAMIAFTTAPSSS